MLMQLVRIVSMGVFVLVVIGGGDVGNGDDLVMNLPVHSSWNILRLAGLFAEA